MTERATQSCLHTPSQPCTTCTGFSHSVIPGDNLTACRIGRIRYAASTFCLPCPSLPSSQIRIKVLSYTSTSPAAISRTLTFPLYHHRYTHPPTHPYAHPNTSPSVDIHSPSTPPPTPALHLISPFHQLRVCLMTGASSNKPAVYQYLRTQGMRI
jgi:hypothetical protein